MLPPPNVIDSNLFFPKYSVATNEALSQLWLGIINGIMKCDITTNRDLQLSQRISNNALSRHRAALQKRQGGARKMIDTARGCTFQR